jgi:uncharacterized membrane protein YoaK (UPF0700 family)
MQALPQTPDARIKVAVALLLTFTAGLVDVVGYLTVYHLFTANMTGNTVHLGNMLVAGSWKEAAMAGATIAGFLAGSVLGRMVIESATRKGIRRVASFTLLGEAMLVALFVGISPYLLHSSQPRLASSGAICGLLALLSSVMGLQTATLTRIGPLTIHTTFVTGMLNKLAQAVSHWLLWAHDEWRKGASPMRILRTSGQSGRLRVAKLMAAIWVCYMAGAVAGTVMADRWNTRALILGVLLLLVAVIFDQFRPLSLEEEQEQT